ncbi:MBL fold metallo-hydrolase [Sphingobium fontiphilum]|uniref:MBL fold metallo-hydrolase n=1 Tax=Sphingobium fontiphilum TaxID=944425 RepID=UPI003CCCE244
MRCGDLEVKRVEEARIDVPFALLTGEAGANTGSAPRSFQLVFQSWILRRQDVVILIDPCAGNGRDRPVMPHFHQLETPYLDRLRATGISPGQVDIIFCTHLLCDHCGWNTRRQYGRWVPTFPNARFLLVRREVERWGIGREDHAVIDYNLGVFEDSVQPILDAGLADLVEAGQCGAKGSRPPARG